MNGENDWRSVTNLEAVDELLDLSEDFHDAFTVSSVWQSAESLDSDGNLVLAGYGILSLTIVSQFREVPGLELRFRRVRAFSYDYDGDSEPMVDFAKGWVEARILEWKIEAETFDYRRKPESGDV